MLKISIHTLSKPGYGIFCTFKAEKRNGSLWLNYFTGQAFYPCLSGNTGQSE